MATSKKAAAENYSADDIKHLSPRDALRKKTAMYIGSTDAHGLFTCVREVADNILDEALAGYCTAGTIVAKSGTEFWMHDNGRGMPTGMMEIEDPVSGTKSKIPALQAITSLLHAGGKIDATNSAYKASRGCFTGNTKVRLLNGKVIKLSKLHRAWEAGKFSGGLDILIFDRRTKKLVPSKISDVILSKYVDVLTRVHTTSGGYVDCTPDHKFYVNSGEVIKGVRADKLVPGTSLVTSYVSYDRDGYLKATEQGTVRRVHRVVAEKTYGRVKKYAHVHHADGTRTNNVPNNLEVLSPAQHQKEHIEQLGEQGRAIMASEQAEPLRRRNSMYMQELADTGRLIKQQRQTICLNIAARAMYTANTEVLTRAVYNADRLDNDPHWKTALKWFNSESEFVNRAHARLLELKAKQFRSLRAHETLLGERTTGTAGLSKIGSDAARINNFLRILDCAGGMQATPEAFNVRVGDTVFGSYAKLCAFTSLKNLKELYSGKTNILKRFSEESFDDVTARMVKAELAVSSAQVRYNRALGFLARASRAGAPACTVEAIDLIISKENPKNPTASRQTLHLGLSCAKKEFGKSLSKHYINFNTKVVRVETINLRTPVPVFDITIDHPSHNFFVQLDGTHESDKETHVLVSNSHAIGQKATNFLSEYFKVTTFSAPTKGAEKQWHAIEYLDGKLSSPMKKCKPPVNPLTKEAVKKGTVVEFKLNTSFFTDKSFSPSLLVEYLKIASYFTPGFKWTLSSASGKSKVFHSERGVLDYLDDYKESLKEVSSLKEGNILQASSGLFDVALDFTNADGSHLKGFTNGLLNSEGGTHVNATLQALLKSVTPFAKKNQVFSSTELREGLVGLINVKLSAPRFTSQVKVRLDDERADTPLRDSLLDEFTKFFKKNKSLAELICERCTKLKELKSKFLASKAVVTAINKTKAKGFPAKALAAPNCKPEQRELYIVEGDSAKGPVTAERDAFYQEALPIRGKIMNAHRATPAKFFSSDEVIDLLAMIGFDPKNPDPLGKLRVNKLIFLTDADSDGFHISVLLLSMIHKYLPDLIDRGMVYVADIPEYMAEVKGKPVYGDSKIELQEKLQKLGAPKATIHHFKGLGEMESPMLKAMALDPQTRRLRKVTRSTVDNADSQFVATVSGDASTRRTLLGI